MQGKVFALESCLVMEIKSEVYVGLPLNFFRYSGVRLKDSINAPINVKPHGGRGGGGGLPAGI